MKSCSWFIMKDDEIVFTDLPSQKEAIDKALELTTEDEETYEIFFYSCPDDTHVTTFYEGCTFYDIKGEEDSAYFCPAS